MKIFSESPNLPSESSSGDLNNNNFNSRSETSNIIYESYKRKQLGESKNSKIKILIVSLSVAFNIIILIILLQYNQYVQKFFFFYFIIIIIFNIPCHFLK